jgi:hypothetical protein
MFAYYNIAQTGKLNMLHNNNKTNNKDKKNNFNYVLSLTQMSLTGSFLLPAATEAIFCFTKPMLELTSWRW